jgi:hypothetical protein
VRKIGNFLALSTASIRKDHPVYKSTPLAYQKSTPVNISTALTYQKASPVNISTPVIRLRTACRANSTVLDVYRKLCM